MRYALTMLAVFAMLTSAYADKFYLTDAEGKKHGPFEFKQGEKVTIGDQEYTITRAIVKRQAIVPQLKSIIIPEIEFRQANIQDVIDFLQAQTAARDPQELGVNMILKLPASAKPNLPLVTFSARQISIHEALNIACEVCGLEWSVRNSAIMIEPKPPKKDAAKDK